VFLLEDYDHFDTSVIVELYTSKPTSKKTLDSCKRYLYRVLTKKQTARISMVNLGELKHFILHRISEDAVKIKVIDNLKFWLDKGVEFCSPQWDAFKVALELKELARGLEPMDMLHIATAIEKGAKRFVTIEKSILEMKPFVEKVKNEYGLKIVHS
jgi:predicted nucleic acid-binding protein